MVIAMASHVNSSRLSAQGNRVNAALAAEASKMNHKGTKTRRNSRRRKDGDEHLFCQISDNPDIFLSSS
jgi:hypothetical protein